MANIVFDLDGTLVDSAPDIQAVANAVLAGVGAPPITLDETHGFIGRGAKVFVERMMAARALPADGFAALHARFVELYADACSHAVIYPGAVEALTALQAAGHRLGLCTNKPMIPTRNLLAHLDLARFFDVVIGGDSLAVTKPDPAPLHAAFDGLGGTGLYVGDSETDYLTARNAGVDFALFSGGYRSQPLEWFEGAQVFDDWADLPQPR